LLIKDLVVEDHLNIETGQRVLPVAEARQAETGVFIASIELVEQNVGDTTVNASLP
jgi:hypothetical protein